MARLNILAEYDTYLVSVPTWMPNLIIRAIDSLDLDQQEAGYS